MVSVCPLLSVLLGVSQLKNLEPVEALDSEDKQQKAHIGAAHLSCSGSCSGRRPAAASRSCSACSGPRCRPQWRCRRAAGGCARCRRSSAGLSEQRNKLSQPNQDRHTNLLARRRRRCRPTWSPRRSPSRTLCGGVRR